MLVIGAEPIGLGKMEFARIAGAKVIALDVNESRLKFCKDILKVHNTIDKNSTDIATETGVINAMISLVSVPGLVSD